MNDSESTQVQYASFLVRLWRSGPSAPEECDAGWQGEVEHIQSGRCWSLGPSEGVLAVVGYRIKHDCESIFGRVPGEQP